MRTLIYLEGKSFLTHLLGYSFPYLLFSYPSYSYVSFWFPILIFTYDRDASRFVFISLILIPLILNVLFWFPILISTYDLDAPRGVWFIINEPSYTKSEHQIHVLVFGLTILWHRMRNSIPLERLWHIYSHLYPILFILILTQIQKPLNI